VLAVVDTNILVSALLFPGSKPSRAFCVVRERGISLASADTLLELYEVLMRRKLDRYVSRRERLAFLGMLSRTVALVRPQEKIAVCSDPKDNKFLEVAVAGEADVILTGDQALLDLHPFRSIDLLTPAAFLKRYTSQP
jgi:putative PIN family toxin of toxin-antitoxin system